MRAAQYILTSLLAFATQAYAVPDLAKITHLKIKDGIQIVEWGPLTTFFDAEHSTFAWDQDSHWMPNHRHRCTLSRIPDGTSFKDHYEDNKDLIFSMYTIRPGIYQLKAIKRFFRLLSEQQKNGPEVEEPALGEGLLASSEYSRFTFSNQKGDSESQHWGHIITERTVTFVTRLKVSNERHETKSGKPFSINVRWRCTRDFTAADGEYDNTELYTLDDFKAAVGEWIEPLSIPPRDTEK